MYVRYVYMQYLYNDVVASCSLRLAHHTVLLKQQQPPLLLLLLQLLGYYADGWQLVGPSKTSRNKKLYLQFPLAAYAVGTLFILIK